MTTYTPSSLLCACASYPKIGAAILLLVDWHGKRGRGDFVARISPEKNPPDHQTKKKKKRGTTHVLVHSRGTTQRVQSFSVFVEYACVPNCSGWAATHVSGARARVHASLLRPVEGPRSLSPAWTGVQAKPRSAPMPQRQTTDLLPTAAPRFSVRAVSRAVLPFTSVSPSTFFSPPTPDMFSHSAGRTGSPLLWLVERVSSPSPPGKRVCPALTHVANTFHLCSSPWCAGESAGPHLSRYFRYFRPIFGLIFLSCVCVCVYVCVRVTDNLWENPTDILFEH